VEAQRKLVDLDRALPGFALRSGDQGISLMWGDAETTHAVLEGAIDLVGYLAAAGAEPRARLRGLPGARDRAGIRRCGARSRARDRDRSGARAPRLAAAASVAAAMASGLPAAAFR
jgi:hypothetical protein